MEWSAGERIELDRVPVGFGADGIARVLLTAP